MTKRIFMICKGQLDKAIPIISLSQAFKNNKYDVSIICSNISSPLERYMSKNNIVVKSLNLKVDMSNKGLLSKIKFKINHWFQFRYKVKFFLKSISNTDLLYISTADTAISLKGLIKEHTYFIHLRELYDEFPIYMKLLKKIVNNASQVIVPEQNRAYIYYNLFNLKEIPKVIPNKPFTHLRNKKLDIDKLVNAKNAQKIKNKKNILYQGPLRQERDISNLVEAVNANDEFNLILMGKDQGMLSKYKLLNKDIIHIDFVSPPNHLNITSWAHIGIVGYDLKSLNTIYCAPNKIWEYSGFSIPMIYNINPGLTYILDKWNAGVCIDFNKKNAINNAISMIDSDYEKFSNNSKIFYESFDYEKEIKQWLKKI
tara:strand:+ start:315 stop:1424 length:1110 start_codon:yes stop_codon:yes gene_type:complete